MTDLVSVIIPTYNHSGSLPDCLRSVLAQTYQNIEVIVVNDGSTDHTEDVLQSFCDKVRVIHQENQGANPARNRGWKEAKGSCLLFCDADVVLQPRMIELLSKALDAHPQTSIAYSGFRFGWKRFKGVAFDPELLKKRNYIHTTSLVRASDFPGFDPTVKRLQDWDVWLTMVRNGCQAVLVNEDLFRVRVEGKSRIGSSWLPSCLYRVNWKRIGWTPAGLKAYEQARAILVKKHGI